MLVFGHIDAIIERNFSMLRDVQPLESCHLSKPAGTVNAGMLKDGTRLIFWIDILILLIVCGLVLAGQWDLVIALFIALAMLNYFDHGWNHRLPKA